MFCGVTNNQLLKKIETLEIKLEEQKNKFDETIKKSTIIATMVILVTGIAMHLLTTGTLLASFVSVISSAATGTGYFDAIYTSTNYALFGFAVTATIALFITHRMVMKLADLFKNLGNQENLSQLVATKI